jgi:hypothetical protein
MPLTLQETEVSGVLVTVAEKGSELPRRTEPELGAMATVICGGGGGDVVPPPPPPHAAWESVRMNGRIDWVM